MGQRSDDASAKDARIMLSKEECAEGTGQRLSIDDDDATAKDARIKSSVEEYVGGTGHIAINDESTVRILPNRSTFHSFSICSVAITTLVWMLPQLIPPHCTKDIRTIPQNGEVAIIVIFHGLNDIIKFQLLVIMSRSCCTCAPIVSLPFF